MKCLTRFLNNMTKEQKLEAIRKAGEAQTAKLITLEHVFIAYAKTEMAIKLPLTISEKGDLAWGMSEKFFPWILGKKCHQQDSKTIDFLYNLIK